MIIKAKHHWFLYPFFTWFAARIIRKNFNDVQIINHTTDKNLPILLLSNHSSWWDGFWVQYVQKKLFNRKFYFMMLEDQLRKHWYFKYTGGFSVNKESRSILETINYTAQLLENNNSLVLMFPQGKIQSLHIREFHFEKGIEYIVKKTKKPFQLLMCVNLIDYFSSPKPTLYVYLKEYETTEYTTDAISAAYNRFYEECIKYQTNRDSN
ncbi:MAG: lysophospholipid acyltransferase family protein [Bacteroidales bacterium]